MRINSQVTWTLRYLKSHPYLTSRTAWSEFGITRLSSIIHKLRKLGYNIQTVMVEGLTRNGEACTYARYFLKEEEDEQSN